MTSGAGSGEQRQPQAPAGPKGRPGTSGSGSGQSDKGGSGRSSSTTRRRSGGADFWGRPVETPAADGKDAGAPDGMPVRRSGRPATPPPSSGRWATRPSGPTRRPPPTISPPSTKRRCGRRRRWPRPTACWTTTTPGDAGPSGFDPGLNGSSRVSLPGRGK